VSVAFPGGKTVVRRVRPELRRIEVWEGGFFAGAYTRGRHQLHLYSHDRSRLRGLLFLMLGAAAAVFLFRWAVRKMAQNIARRKYLHELEGKNRELERLIEEVRRTQQQLIQSEKLAGLGQLVAGIAHELNNPIGFIYANLHQIQGYLDALGSEPGGEGRQALLRKARTALEESREGSKRVRDIVQNLRGISRAGAHPQGGPLEKEPQDLNLLLDKSLILAQTSFSKNIEISKDYAELPSVPCDATQIQQVFLNILVNAGQAMGDKGHLRLRSFQEGRTVCVSVSDTGPGVSAEHKTRLFDPFFTTKPVGQGLGLGLHISYDIVRAHGGSLEVHSEPGKGAEFVVKLQVE
jgi:signal transduction histidine kinase